MNHFLFLFLLFLFVFLPLFAMALCLAANRSLGDGVNKWRDDFDSDAISSSHPTNGPKTGVAGEFQECGNHGEAVGRVATVKGGATPPPAVTPALGRRLKSRVAHTLAEQPLMSPDPTMRTTSSTPEFRSGIVTHNSAVLGLLFCSGQLRKI